jgi:uncharacterized protein
MKLHKARLFFAGLALLLAPTIPSIARALDIPALRGRVNDYAGIIRADKAQQLEERLARFEQETGHQIAILTIPSLEGDALEDFGIRVAESWKIGQKGFDNGAILIVAQKDRKLRIEVGYGLEGVLPDAIANRIISEIIVPRFRENDYSGGIEAGVNAILQVTKGESLPELARKPQGSRRSDPSSIVGLLFMIILVALAMGMTQRSASRAAASGAISSAIIGFIGAATVGVGLWLAAVFVGSLASVLANLYTRQTWGRTWDARSRYRDDYSPRDVFRGGYWGGGFGGGGFGGGDFGGGGGFSGGGGGFGGGGASGSW